MLCKSESVTEIREREEKNRKGEVVKAFLCDAKDSDVRIGDHRYLCQNEWDSSRLQLVSWFVHSALFPGYQQFPAVN